MYTIFGPEEKYFIPVPLGNVEDPRPQAKFQPVKSTSTYARVAAGITDINPNKTIETTVKKEPQKPVKEKEIKASHNKPSQKPETTTEQKTDKNPSPTPRRRSF
jgi:hypothetical protein